MVTLTRKQAAMCLAVLEMADDGQLQKNLDSVIPHEIAQSDVDGLFDLLKGSLLKGVVDEGR